MFHLNQKKSCKKILFSFAALTLINTSCVYSTASSDNDLLSFQNGECTKTRRNATQNLTFQTRREPNGSSYDNIKNFSIRGMFPSELIESIVKSFTHIGNTKTSGHLHVSKLDQIHLTVTTIKRSDDGIGIESRNIGRVLGRASQHFLPQYNGRFYGLYMLVNGVDATGRKVTAHYSSPEAFRKAMSSPIHQFHTTNSSKPLTAHFVLRFGTNPAHDMQHQTELPKDTIQNIGKMDGALQRDIKAFETELQSQTDFRSAYENVTTHITVALLKSQTGAVDQNWPALNLDHAYTIFRKTYEAFKGSGLENQRATMTMSSVKVEQQFGKPRFWETRQIF